MDALLLLVHKHVAQGLKGNWGNTQIWGNYPHPPPPHPHPTPTPHTHTHTHTPSIITPNNRLRIASPLLTAPSADRPANKHYNYHTNNNRQNTSSVHQAQETSSQYQQILHVSTSWTIIIHSLRMRPAIIIAWEWDMQWSPTMERAQVWDTFVHLNIYATIMKFLTFLLL